MESRLIQFMKQNDPETIQEFIVNVRLQGELLSRDKFVHLVQCATLCKEYDLSRGCRPNYNYLKKYKKI